MGRGLESALKVRDLVVRYGDKVVLDGIDMTVPAGDIRVILGGSGSGKSTLMRGILGLIPVAAGTVEMLGQELAGLDPDDRAIQLRRVGVMFQNGALFGSLTIAENVALPVLEHTHLPREVVAELVRMKLELVSLGHARDLYPSELSGGMIKRAALARAMVLDPDILFCDEPSAGLDPLTSKELDGLLLQTRALFGTTIVVVTHELASIEGIADSIIYLGQGDVIAEGPIAHVRALGLEVIDNFFARRTEGQTRGGTALNAIIQR